MAVSIDSIFTTGGQHEIVEIHGAAVAEATDETLLKLAEANDDKIPATLIRSPDGATALIIRWEGA